jgi:hypothetical protein
VAVALYNNGNRNDMTVQAMSVYLQYNFVSVLPSTLSVFRLLPSVCYSFCQSCFLPHSFANVRMLYTYTTRQYYKTDVIQRTHVSCLQYQCRNRTKWKSLSCKMRFWVMYDKTTHTFRVLPIKGKWKEGMDDLNNSELCRPQGGSPWLCFFRGFSQIT